MEEIEIRKLIFRGTGEVFLNKNDIIKLLQEVHKNTLSMACRVTIENLISELNNADGRTL